MRHQLAYQKVGKSEEKPAIDMTSLVVKAPHKLPMEALAEGLPRKIACERSRDT